MLAKETVPPGDQNPFVLPEITHFSFPFRAEDNGLFLERHSITRQAPTVSSRAYTAYLPRFVFFAAYSLLLSFGDLSLVTTSLCLKTIFGNLSELIITAQFKLS
jgi:hypothetical protein